MSRKVAHLLLLTTAFLWGINFISLKYLSGIFPTFSLVFIKYGIASLFMWFILIQKRKKDSSLKTLERVDYKNIFITGLLGFSLYSYFQLFSFTYLSANLAALLCALVPIFSLIAEQIFSKKRCALATYFLSMLSIFGVYLVLDMRPKELFASNAVWGILLMTLANICWVAYTMQTTKLQDKYGSFTSLTFQMTAGTFVLGLTAIKDFQLALSTLTSSSNALIIVLNLLFLGIGTSALAYLFYIEGMKVIGIQLASLYINVLPVVTAIVSFFVFKEQFSMQQMTGMLLVVSSIVLINKVEARSKQDNSKRHTEYSVSST